MPSPAEINANAAMINRIRYMLADRGMMLGGVAIVRGPDTADAAIVIASRPAPANDHVCWFWNDQTRSFYWGVYGTTESHRSFGERVAKYSASDRIYSGADLANAFIAAEARLMPDGG